MVAAKIIQFRQPDLLPSRFADRPPEAYETAAPKPIKLEKKNPVVIEAMPGEPLPEGCLDYRPHLQRDGLLLFSWEIYGDDIKIVWYTASGNMYKYQALVDDEADLPTACPENRYEDWRGYYYHGEIPDRIVYAAPPELSAQTCPSFIAMLRESGIAVDFDYVFTLGKQKAARDAAVLGKIEKRQCESSLSAEEAELLEAYRQFNYEDKLAFVEYAKTLLAGQSQRETP